METWDITFNSVQKKPALAWTKLAGKSFFFFFCNLFVAAHYVVKLLMEIKNFSQSL